MPDPYERFLDRRRKLLRAWRYLGPVLLVGIVAFAVYQYNRTPMMMNPYAVIEAIQAETLETPTMQLMAMFVPILFDGLFVLLIAMVLVIYGALGNERRYLAIIEDLKTPACRKD